MVFELALAETGKIIGFEFIMFMMIMFSFVLMMVSRGLGISAVLGVVTLSSWLFHDKLVLGIQMLPTDIFVTILLVIFALGGLMFWSIFLSKV